MSQWRKITTTYPEASAGAQLFMCERAELAALQKLKTYPVRAILLLERSIKQHANDLIQQGVTA